MNVKEKEHVKVLIKENHGIAIQNNYGNVKRILNFNGNCTVTECSGLNGKNISIEKGGIMVDGMPLEDYEEQQNCRFAINITINGNCELIKNCDNVTVNGDCENVSTISGNVECNTIKGSVNTVNGDVTCDEIGGSASTVNGDIRYNN